MCVYVSDQHRVTYLLSSTATPYIRDILDILLLPPGFTYRFRYDLKWIADDLKSQELLDQAPNEGLIVHAHLSALQNNGVITNCMEELIPIRKVRIIEKKIVGDFVLLQFRLESYAEFRQPWDGTKNDYNDSLQRVLPPPRQIGKYFSSSFLFVGDSIDPSYVDDSMSLFKDGRSTNNWTNLVSHIASLKPHVYSKPIFLKLLTIATVADDQIIIPTEISSDFFGFELEADTTYRIKILQRSFTNVATPFMLKFSADSDIFKPIKDSTLIQGKYDILEFIIATTDIEKSKYTSFLINAENQSSSPINPFVCNCKIKANAFKRNVLFAVIAAGIAATGATSFFEDIAYKAALTAVGTGLVAISSKFLLR